MTAYSLLPINGTVGTFSVKLFSEFAGLTIPTGQSVKQMGVLEEVADIEAGIIQASKLSITLIDDYSTYTEGFWYKVLAGDCQIRFYLDQGDGDTFYFFGTPQAETIQWTEHYIGSTRVRTVSLDLISVVATMFSVLADDWIGGFVDAMGVVEGAVDTGYAVTQEPSWLIRPAGLFAAMLSSSGLNPSYDLADVSFVWDSGPDMKFTSGAGTFRFDEIYVPVLYYDGAFAPPGHRPTFYFTATANGYYPYVPAPPYAQPSLPGPPTQSQPLQLYYPKLQGLIGDLLRNFGLVMRMDYDVVGERHLIQLIQRGRAYPTNLDFGSREKESSISKGFNLLGDATRSIDLVDSSKFCWMSKRFGDFPSIYEVPSYVSLDVDSPAIFRINTTAAQGGSNRSLYSWDGVAGHAPLPVASNSYYNYTSGADVAATATDALMQEGIAGYIYHRFTTAYSMIVRKYRGFNADDGTTDDHTTLSIIRPSLIDDGVSSEVYYANKVKKFAEDDEVEVEWIREAN